MQTKHAKPPMPGDGYWFYAPSYTKENFPPEPVIVTSHVQFDGVVDFVYGVFIRDPSLYPYGLTLTVLYPSKDAIIFAALGDP